MNRYAAHTGMIVQFAYKGKIHVARVEKVNPKNIKVMTTDGRTWNVSPSLLSPSTLDFDLDTSKSFSLGTVVNFASKPGTLFVIIKQRSEGNYNIAELGGSKDGKYYTGVSVTSLEQVDFALEGV